jgi:AcrR family transcriptional regulator
MVEAMGTVRASSGKGRGPGLTEGYCPCAMTTTPWGPADQLKEKRLRPGPGSERDAVVRNQRSRLLGATVAVVSQRGYEKTRVADIVEMAGVSRGAFYSHFANKEECFVAAVETIVKAGAEEIAAVHRSHAGSWEDQLAAGLDKLIELVVAQPAAARLRFLELQAAGREAVERVERIDRELDDLALGVLEHSDRAGAPRHLVTAINGGFRRIIERRLRAGRERELDDLRPELLDWALSYALPTEPLREPERPPPQFDPPRPDPTYPRDRIMVAVTELVAEKGYPAVKVSDIATRASTSLSTFYANFRSKEEALLAALEYSTRLVLEATVPTFKQESDWPHALGTAMHATFAYLALEPTFAEFGGVDVYTGAPMVRERRDQLIVAAQAFLTEGHRQHPETSAVAAEAIGGSIDTLIYEHVRRKGAESLYEAVPAAIFLALTPFVGTEEATRIANEEWKP